MKKIFITALVIFSAVSVTVAQKFGYIDSDYILGQMPEYKSAQKALDDMAAGWQKNIEDKLAEIDRMYRDYQDEKVLLTEDIRKKREQAIVDKEKVMKDFQKQKFGPEGDLFKKRQELVKPIQDKVFDAVQKVARKSGLDFLFDKNGEMTMMFANAKFDKSDEVLEEMGITPPAPVEKEKNKKDIAPKPGDKPAPKVPR